MTTVTTETQYCDLAEIFRQDVTQRRNDTALTPEQAEVIMPIANEVLVFIQHGTTPLRSPYIRVAEYWRSLDRYLSEYIYGFLARFVITFGDDASVMTDAMIERLAEMEVGIVRQTEQAYHMVNRRLEVMKEVIQYIRN